jgi:hypothetical protein
VVLNGCFDDALAEALVDVVDVAMGTAATISDSAARSFAVGLYRALAYGYSVGNAFEQAIATLMARGLDDADIPRLRARAGVVPGALHFRATPRSDHAVLHARKAASPAPTAPIRRVSPSSPAQVVWLFAHDDEAHARELLRRAVVLEEQGLIRNRSVLDVPHGHSISRSLIEHSRGADVVVILTSPALLEDDSWRAVMAAGPRARIVPVLLRSSSLPPELATWTPLPTDGQPIISRRDRDEALREVIQDLEEVVRLRSIAEPTVRPPATPGTVVRDLIIDEIYRTGGPPTVTFVEPPRFGQLRLALRNMGTGLIIEGPSRVGKSTAVKKAMESIRIAESDQIWLYGQDRASLQAEALARALIKLGPSSPSQLRIAVFHHPIHSGEDSRIRDAAFLQQLAVHGFRLALHGHVHRADATLYRYDRSVDGRQLEVVAAGTFGAPTHEWVPGYPLQYNLLLVGTDKVTVETRCRQEVNGAWAPDARWQQGEGKDPAARYAIPLRSGASRL